MLFCLTVGIASDAGPAVAADAFVVIVNSANPVSSLRARDASDLFLKKTTQWSNGIKSSPVDFAEGAPVRDSFSKSVHQKGVAAITSYWRELIFSGREIPPPQKTTAGEVAAYVGSHYGGIGYVPAGTPLGAGVKVLAMRP